MKSGIYIILNLINGKYYIGSTINFRDRFWRHEYLLNYSCHPNIFLQRAWYKYGIDAFQFTIIEYVEDVNKLIEIEQKWIDASKCYNDEIGYNLSPTAGNNLGVKLSNETKAKISKASKNKKLSIEHIEAIKKANKGRKFTEEHKKKMSISRKGRKFTEEWKQKISKHLIGNKYRRDLNKWSCNDGYKCKCENCIKIKKEAYNEWHRNWRKNRLVASNNNASN